MALIPPFFLNCVVAIGIDNPEGQRQWVASGFLYGHYLREDPDRGPLYRTYLVTNRHVLREQKVVYLRFNPKDNQPAREYTVDFVRPEDPAVVEYHADPEIDLAVVGVNAHVLINDGIEFNYFQSNKHIATKESLTQLGITEGDYGYVLGFPMGLIGKERSFVIVRHGTIARIRDYLCEGSKEILMDCLIFPGNSGGPVVLKPEVVAIQGTRASSSAHLIGVIRRYIPYQDVAVSLQTKRPRVVFEDNSGLASIVPIQYLVDLIETLQTGEEAGESQAEEAHLPPNE